MKKFLSKDGAKFQKEIIEDSITSRLYFIRNFSSHFTDTADFYELSKHDQELIRAEMQDLAQELASFCEEYTERLAYKTENYLFTEQECNEAPR